MEFASQGRNHFTARVETSVDQCYGGTLGTANISLSQLPVNDGRLPQCLEKSPPA